MKEQSQNCGGRTGSVKGPYPTCRGSTGAARHSQESPTRNCDADVTMQRLGSRREPSGFQNCRAQTSMRLVGVGLARDGRTFTEAVTFNI